MDDYPLPNYDAEHVWMLDGHCRGREPSFFFPSDGVGVDRARRIQKFFSQPFFVAQQFTGAEGKYVELKDTVRSFKEIIEGKHDDIPEQAFYLKGGIEDVIAAAEKLKQTA